ncbi:MULTISPECIES: efflux RND transporter periplasmic adaptor subunit [unclassified Janthinobacterium]|uniref:efflux RND transporter periplasmic adaptor subunit n=1 Tax=unclassified Janthinobacterium TaxID=2610881 RepID=UPI001857EF0B|nr:MULTISPECIES: efflux RND transporter periplasmic adaptor subunit [unclassified Janthinobacterium]MBB5610253.1 HlyD family secretion protein [Janthinobacterium sp. S3T4]MBB5615621.1 HlyD family secretion protein [Janthinobacterium sp. S3M3]
MSRLPTSGAAMDTHLPRSRRKAVIVILASLLLAVLAAIGWWAMPHGLPVAAADLRIGVVERGIFLDEVVVRASAEPLNSVILDSVESGRIEEVYASDGALVKKGQLLFRISNPQRNLELLARKAEHAQQIFNLSNLRVAQQASSSEHQRRLDDLRFALQQGGKQHARNLRLSQQGFISGVALEESADRLHQQQRALAQEQQAAQLESQVRRDAAAQLEASIQGLSSGLLLVGATVDALAVRAPSDGRLTDFRLQVGESISTGKNVGRIDDPARYKLSAKVDEFYLNRMAAGRQASMLQDGRSYALAVQTIYPQIKEGRFTVELVFSKGQPPVLNPGQSLDAQITLGEPAPALLLPNGAFINDSGGAWVFVLDESGTQAQRRDVRIGRRNNSQLEVLDGLRAGERVILSGYTTYGNSPQLHIKQ